MLYIYIYIHTDVYTLKRKPPGWLPHPHGVRGQDGEALGRRLRPFNRSETQYMAVPYKADVRYMAKNTCTCTWICMCTCMSTRHEYT